MRSFQLFILFVFILCSFSCNEEEDNIPPTIQIISPTSFENFAVGDVINVEAKLIDDQQLTKASTFLRLNRTIEMVGPQQSLSGTEADIKMSFALSDTLLKSANYSLQVEAGDGTSTSSSFVSINIAGIPVRELSYLISTYDGLNSRVYEYNGLITKQLATFSFEIDLMEVDHRRQILYITDKSNPKIVQFDLKGQQLLSESQLQGISGRYYTSLVYSNPYIYAGTNQGEIFSYSNSLTGSLIYDSNENGSIESIVKLEDKLLFEENYIGNLPSKLTSVLSSGGNFIFRSDINGEILSIGADDQNQIGFIVANSSQSFEFYELDLATGIRTLKHNSNQTILNSLSYNLAHHLLVDSSALYTFKYPQNETSLYNTGLTSFDAIELSQLHQQFAVGSDKSLKIFNYANGSMLTSISLAEPIKSLAVRNNL